MVPKITEMNYDELIIAWKRATQIEDDLTQRHPVTRCPCDTEDRNIKVKVDLISP